MDLSEHFTYEELTRSSYAIRAGIDNTPPANLLPNLALLASGLERVRAVLAMPIHVDSGYRCPAVNAGVGGRLHPPSEHTLGLAADIICPAFGTPRQIAEALIARQADVRFSKLIQEGDWLHVAFVPDGPQGQVLTAHFGVGPVNYTQGLT